MSVKQLIEKLEQLKDPEALVRLWSIRACDYVPIDTLHYSAKQHTVDLADVSSEDLHSDEAIKHWSLFERD